MKKLIFTAVFSLIVTSMFAQSNEAPTKMKYVTQAPDGSVSLTIYDDSRDATMKLESANTFYKYQILDPSTNEALYSAENNGNECTIDKDKVAAGTYDIRLFTNNFVITSKIIVSSSRSLVNGRSEVSFAMNEKK